VSVEFGDVELPRDHAIIVAGGSGERRLVDEAVLEVTTVVVESPSSADRCAIAEPMSKQVRSSTELSRSCASSSRRVAGGVMSVSNSVVVTPDGGWLQKRGVILLQNSTESWFSWMVI
jgi:hypothetical protein